MAAVLDVEQWALLVRAAIQGAAEGGANRQGLAAATAAALRTSAQLMVSPRSAASDAEHAPEVEARMEAIQTALALQVAGRPVPGNQRLARNVAAHVGLGEGAAVLRSSLTSRQGWCCFLVARRRTSR